MLHLLAGFAARKMPRDRRVHAEAPFERGVEIACFVGRGYSA